MKEFWKITGATLVGLVIFMFVRLFFFLSILGSMLSSNSSSPTTLKPHSVYKLEFDGQVKERINDDDDFTSSINEAMGRDAEAYGLNDILENIRVEKSNDNIDGIYLYGGSLETGLATRKEIRDALKDFKESGKFVLAYATNYSQGTYYISSVADKVCMNPTGSVDWKGLYAGINFYKQFLDKLGIKMQVFKVGTYKSAVEPYILSKMSDANREQMNVFLGDMWGDMISEVSESRNLSVEKLNELADRSMLFESEKECLAAGLIDTLVYEEQMDSILRMLCDTKDYKLVSHSKMNGVRDELSKSKDIVAMVYAEGQIYDSGNSGIVGKDMIETLDKIAEKDEVKAVVFRVNSPGGSAAASEVIWYALSQIKEKGKPVVVSMGDYAASGGYYISCNADYILAQPTTLTGSIGIFGLIPEVSGLTDKIGVNYEGVGTNRNSGLTSEMVIKGMNKEQCAQMQREIERGYDLFTRRCADGRGVSQDDIKKIAEGRVWSGRRGVELGLVDSLGNISDAVNKAAELAGIDDWKVVEYPEPESTLTRLMKAFNMEARIDRYAEKTLGEAYKAAKTISNLNLKPSIEARMEYDITIE